MPERMLAAWLPNDTPALRIAIVRRALLDVGLCEVPLGSNRSGRIDEYNTAAGAPLGSYWCAATMYVWWKEAGAATPKRGLAPSCDEWMKWAKFDGLWREKPQPGYAVLFGKPTDAVHIGLIVRTDPVCISIEGNTSTGASFERNGIAIWPKHLDPKVPKIIGYIEPRAT